MYGLGNLAITEKSPVFDEKRLPHINICVPHKKRLAGLSDTLKWILSIDKKLFFLLNLTF